MDFIIDDYLVIILINKIHVPFDIYSPPVIKYVTDLIYQSHSVHYLSNDFYLDFVLQPPQSFLTTMEDYVKEAPRATLMLKNEPVSADSIRMVIVSKVVSLKCRTQRCWFHRCYPLFWKKCCVLVVLQSHLTKHVILCYA